MNEQLKIIISAEVSKLKQNMEKAKTSIKDFATKGIKDVDKFKESLKTLGEKSSAAMKTVGIAVAGAATALLALGASTKEYRTEQAKLTTAFEAAGSSADQAKETYNDLYRVLGDSGKATEAAGHLAKLTKEQESLSQWTTICQGIYATFGDSLPIESLTEAANETAKTGALTGALADALNWAGINEEEFQASLEACNDEAEREKLIRETLNGIYTDAAAKYEQNAADVLKQNEAQAKLDETLAKLGETVAPIITMFTDFATNVLAALMPYLEDFAKKYLPDVENALKDVGKAIGEVIQWIADNWEWIKGVAAVIGAIAAAIALMNAIMTIYNIVAAVAAVVSAPIVLIILAIVAAVALAIVYWDEICAAVEYAVNAIVDWVTDLWSSITEVFTAGWNEIVKLFTGVGEWFYNTVIAPIGEFFSGMWNGIKNGAQSAWNGIKSVFSTVANFFGNIFSNAWEKVKAVFSVGGKIFDGIKDGIVSAFKAIVNAIITGINKVIGLPFNAINGVLKTIKGIEILGLQPFSWVGTISVPQIPKLARGGILTQSTLIEAGEAGTEAILPLENNLEWLDKLADMLGKRMGTSAPVVLQVDGKTFAQISVDSINQLTKQTGNLPLVLV